LHSRLLSGWKCAFRCSVFPLGGNASSAVPFFVWVEPSDQLFPSFCLHGNVSRAALHMLVYARTYEPGKCSNLWQVEERYNGGQVVLIQIHCHISLSLSLFLSFSLSLPLAFSVSLTVVSHTITQHIDRLYERACLFREVFLWVHCGRDRQREG
jgi:hypothetical protein